MNNYAFMRKIDQGMGVGEHITLKTRMAMTIHMLYVHPLHEFWLLLWNHTQRCLIVGQIWSRNGLPP